MRTPEEFAAGHLPGALNLPLDELRSRRGELPTGRLMISCGVGQRGNVAVRALTQLGRDAVNLDGGYRTWCAGTGCSTGARERGNQDSTSSPCRALILVTTLHPIAKASRM